MNDTEQPDRLGDCVCDNGHRHFQTSEDNGYPTAGGTCECGATIRRVHDSEQVITTAARCTKTGHFHFEVHISGDNARCRLPDGHPGACAFYDPAAVRPLIVWEYAEHLRRPEAIERAAMWLYGPTPEDWKRADAQVQEFYRDKVRCVLALLDQHTGEAEAS